MNVPLVYEPLLSWPGALRDDDERQFSDFKASWSDTLDVLDREAYMLDGDRVVVRLAAPPSAFYADRTGMKADRRAPDHPGVVVVVESSTHGVLTYHTDRFKSRGYRASLASWQHNVRAIALGMEALRRVDRYGIADAGQQYAGFRAIGTGLAMSAIPAPLTLDEAARLIADALSCAPAFVLADADVARRGYRAAVRLLHPDHGGSGDGAKMARLHEAWGLVKAHHGMDT